MYAWYHFENETFTTFSQFHEKRWYDYIKDLNYEISFCEHVYKIILGTSSLFVLMCREAKVVNQSIRAHNARVVLVADTIEVVYTNTS